MLKGMAYSPKDSLFFSIAALIDRVTKRNDDSVLRKIRRLYLVIFNQLLYFKTMSEGEESAEIELDETIGQLKTFLKVFFGDPEHTNFFTLRFHTLNHMVEGVDRFGTLIILHATPFQHLYLIIKRFIRNTSIRRGSTLDQAVILIISSVAN